MRGKGRWAAAVATLGVVAATGAPAHAAPVPAPVPAPAPPSAPGPPPVLPPPPGFPTPAAPAPRTAVPPPLDWLTAAKTAGGAVTARHGALQQLAAARAKLTRAQKNVGVVRARLAGVRDQIAVARDRIAQLDRAAAITLDQERERAVRAYMGGDDAMVISDLLSASTLDDQARRAIYADAGQSVDAHAFDEIGAEATREHGVLATLQRHERATAVGLTAASDAVAAAYKSLVMLTAVVNDASHGGRVFPVDGPFDFGDSWGAFRATVAVDTGQHGHDATDIMAPLGTPVVAIEAGTLDRIGWNTLGGWRLWIDGVSGTKYYYAHLSAYASGLAQGTMVLAGQYLGRVGNTGNAAGGPTHLHIEVHLPAAPPGPVPPGPVPPVGAPVAARDGIVVNPYPLLCLLAGAPVPTIPPPDPVVPPVAPGPTTSTVPPNPRGG